MHTDKFINCVHNYYLRFFTLGDSSSITAVEIMELKGGIVD
jgi:hypothetical protein